MEQALRPHRGGTVLALGILSLIGGVLVVPLGVSWMRVVIPILIVGGFAWRMASRDLKAMDEGRVDPAGRSQTQIGRVFGIAAMVIWLGLAGCAVLMLPGHRYSSWNSAHGESRTTLVGFTDWYFFGASAPAHMEYEYHEVQLPSGEWVKEGAFIRRSRTGQKLEEGSYRNGKREGDWTFWNEEGSIDPVRSGIYENDVRVQEGARPAGY